MKLRLAFRFAVCCGKAPALFSVSRVAVVKLFLLCYLQCCCGEALALLFDLPSCCGEALACFLFLSCCCGDVPVYFMFYCVVVVQRLLAF